MWWFFSGISLYVEDVIERVMHCDWYTCFRSDVNLGLLLVVQFSRHSSSS